MSVIEKRTLGGREFAIPEFPIKQQRKITPILVRLSRLSIGELDEDSYGELVDSLSEILVELGLITADEFEMLPAKLLEFPPLIEAMLIQCGLTVGKPGASGATAEAGKDPTNGATENGANTLTT